MIGGKQNKLSICYHGFVENLESMYEKAHIFLYSSNLDSLPRALLQAQTHGLPVLVNDFEAFQELIVHGYNGFLYKTGCFADFKKKLNVLVNDPHLAYSLGKKAIENLRSNYSDQVVGKKLEGVLLNVLGGRN
jgi:poly(glycerol-phosphate) alpha-glucosyltransferase